MTSTWQLRDGLRNGSPSSNSTAGSVTSCSGHLFVCPPSQVEQPPGAGRKSATARRSSTDRARGRPPMYPYGPVTSTTSLPALSGIRLPPTLGPPSPVERTQIPRLGTGTSTPATSKAAWIRSRSWHAISRCLSGTSSRHLELRPTLRRTPRPSRPLVKNEAAKVLVPPQVVGPLLDPSRTPFEHLGARVYPGIFSRPGTPGLRSGRVADRRCARPTRPRTSARATTARRVGRTL